MVLIIFKAGYSESTGKVRLMQIHMYNEHRMLYLTTHAPPAIVFPHPLQCQIPTHFLFSASWKAI